MLNRFLWILFHAELCFATKHIGRKILETVGFDKLIKDKMILHAAGSSNYFVHNGFVKNPKLVPALPGGDTPGGSTIGANL